MRKIQFILLLITATPFIGKSQSAPQQAVITYDLALKLRAQVAKQNPALAAMLPEETHIAIEVSYRNEVFSIISKGSKEGSGTMMIQAAAGDEKHILNLKTRSDRKERTFNKHKYYTETKSSPDATISYSKETKQLLGYTCNKAIVTTADKKQYTVWYTTAIPYAYNAAGLDFSGLHGAVLEYGDDEQNCRAVSINAKSFAAASITPDANAKKISEEQMEDLEEESISNLQPETPAPAKGTQKGKTETQTYKIRL